MERAHFIFFRRIFAATVAFLLALLVHSVGRSANPQSPNSVALLATKSTKGAAAEKTSGGAEYSAPTSGNSSSEILSFQQWKQNKLAEATIRLEEAQKAAGGTEAAREDQPTHSALIQAQWALETAQELEITDYLVLYLSQFLGSKRLEEAAGQLTQSEVATILERYISAVQKSPKSSGPQEKTAGLGASLRVKAGRTSGN